MKKTKSVLFFSWLFYVVIAIYFAYISNNFVGEDASLYLAQAKSLVQGTSKELYDINKLVNGEPFFYPLGFPLLLSPIYYFFGLNFFVFKIYQSLFLLAALLLLWKIFYNNFNNKLFLYILVANIGLSRYFLEYLGDVSSDLAYLFFSLLVIYFFKKNYIDNKITSQKTRPGFFYARNIAFGLLLSFVYNIRSVGIMMAIAIFAFLLLSYLLNKKKDVANILQTIFSIFVPFLLLNFIIKEIYYGNINSHYYSLTSFRLNDIIDNLEIYYRAIGFLFTRSYDVFSAGFFLAITLWGIFCNNRYSRHDALLYCLILFFNLLLLLFYVSQIRFLLPLMPYFYYFFFIGIENIHSYFIKNKNQWGKMASMTIAIVPLAINGFSLANYIPKDGSRFEDNNMQFVISWALTHTRNNDRLCYPVPKVLRLKINNDNILRPVMTIPTASEKNLQTCNYFIYDARMAEYYTNWQKILATKKNNIVANNNVVFIYKIK